MKFSLGYWHCKKLERNGEVAYLLEKEVVVETEVLVGAPLDLKTDEEEEDFLFLFLCTTFSTASLGENTIPVATTMLLCVSFSCFFLPLLWQTPASENLVMLDYLIQFIAYMNKCN